MTEECPITRQGKECDDCPLNIKNREAPVCDNCTYKKMALDCNED